MSVQGDVAAPRRPRRLQIRLLSGFEVCLDGEPVPLLQSGQRLLAYLAVHDQPMERTRVAGALWTSSSEAHAAGCLRSTLWRIHHVDRYIVQVSGSRLLLPREVRVDLADSYLLARQLLTAESVVMESTFGIGAVGALDAELLPDWYGDDWLLLHQEQWRQTRLHALEELVARKIRTGEYAAAVQAGLAAIRGEPLRESAHRCLIEAYLAEDNLVEAIRVYHKFRRMLVLELGVEPSRRLTELLGSVAGDVVVTAR